MTIRVGSVSCVGFGYTSVCISMVFAKSDERVRREMDFFFSIRMYRGSGGYVSLVLRR